jgi:hypothetical protein
MLFFGHIEGLWIAGKGGRGVSSSMQCQPTFYAKDRKQKLNKQCGEETKTRDGVKISMSDIRYR